jgi:type VI secretion system protein VasJ
MESALQTNTEIDSSSLNELIMPIGDQGTGVDPRYGDNFNTVKQEIDRLSDTDYAEVVRLCNEILKHESKDLRVAGYLLLAKVYTEGINGLLDGVRLYYELIKRYGVDCHPHRETARLQSIAWLNSNKLVAFTNKIVVSTDEDRVNIAGLQSLIHSLNSEIISNYGETATTWMSLNPWIDKNLPSEIAKQITDVTQVVEPLPEVQTNVREISSELSFTRSVEGLLSYVAEQRDLLRLVAFSRAMKWSALTLPISERGKTQIQPPRRQVVAEIENHFDGQQAEKKLLDLETFFMEPGCQFYLDLQKREVDAASEMGRQDVQNLIENNLQQLLARLPTLLRLSFSDGTPFASEQTRRWISNLSGENTQGSVVQSEPVELPDKVNKILEKAGSTDLASSITMLDQINATDICDEFHIDMAKIDLCVAVGRTDLAFPLAKRLEELVNRYRLDEWQRSLALNVWDRLLMIHQSDNECLSDEDEKIKTLKGKICATDLAFALRTL